MKKLLKIIERKVWHVRDGLRIEGVPDSVSGDPSHVQGDLTNVWGDLTNVQGDLTNVRGNLTYVRGYLTHVRGYLTNVRGNLSNVRGDLSGVHGDLSGVHGDLDSCGITPKDRDGVRIEDLIDRYTPPAAQRQQVVFPTMLRKVWSGWEVQAWLDENVNKEKNNG